MTTDSGEAGKDQQIEVSLPVNTCTRQGLIALFREREECDESYATNYFPEEVDEAWKDVYSRLSEIESVKISVEYESE